MNMCHPDFRLPKSFHADVLTELLLTLHRASSYSLSLFVALQPGSSHAVGNSDFVALDSLSPLECMLLKRHGLKPPVNLVA